MHKRHGRTPCRLSSVGIEVVNPFVRIQVLSPVRRQWCTKPAYQRRLSRCNKIMRSYALAHETHASSASQRNSLSAIGSIPRWIAYLWISSAFGISNCRACCPTPAGFLPNGGSWGASTACVSGAVSKLESATALVVPIYHSRVMSVGIIVNQRSKDMHLQPAHFIHNLRKLFFHFFHFLLLSHSF